VPILLDALRIKHRHGMSHWDSDWDSPIVAASRALDCRELYSEDMADGWDYGGTTVINPSK
jgi:predicted nucleic acid-binding protein